MAASRPAAVGRTLDLVVLDGATGDPMAGATVEGAGDLRLTTAADGRVAVPVPPANGGFFSVIVRRDRHVGKVLDWMNDGGVPARYTVELPPGRTIGGRVIDDAWHPVAGATAVASLQAGGGGGRPYPPERRDVMGMAATTGADGRWSLNSAPAETTAGEVGAWDYRYVADDAGGSYFRSVNYPSARPLLDGTATTTLHHGVTVAGVVRGPDGRPVRGAAVGFGSDRVGSSNIVPPLVTTSDGRFAFDFAAGSPVVLTVTADGLAPELVRLTAKANGPDVVIRLTPAHRLEGRVVDTDGRPVAHAFVWMDTWRDARSLGDMSMNTDADGRFDWADAPADAVQANVAANGFMRRDYVAVTAGQPNVVQLVRPLHVTGTVTDAVTGKPIAAYRLFHGYEWAKGRSLYFDPTEVLQGRAGTFAYNQTWPHPAYGVRVEAHGYLPTESRRFTDAERSVRLDLKLQPAADWRTLVLRPDGHPAAGALATLVRPDNVPFTFDGQLDSPVISQLEQFRSATDGRLDLPPERGTAAVVVTAPAGYAAVDQDAMAAGRPIRLRAWATVRGRVTIGVGPARGRLVVLSQDPGWQQDEPSVSARMTATSDPDGRFAWDHVPPGPVSVGVESAGPGGARWVATGARNTDARSGEVTEVTLDAGR